MPSSSRRAAAPSASRSAATADGARIDVTDTGVGIDPTELPHIFERFYRGSRANEARGSGSRTGARDRPQHRGHARRHGHGGERDRRRQPVHGPPAARSARGRRDPGGGPGGRGRRPRRAPAGSPRRPRVWHRPTTARQRRRGQRDGNFTVRRVADESGFGTLKPTEHHPRPLTGRCLQGNHRSHDRLHATR